MKLLYLILRDLSILKDSAHTGKSAPLPATPVDHSPGTSRSPARNTGTGYSTAPIPHPATAPHTAGRGRLPGPVPRAGPGTVRVRQQVAVAVIAESFRAGSSTFNAAQFMVLLPL